MLSSLFFCLGVFRIRPRASAESGPVQALLTHLRKAKSRARHTHGNSNQNHLGSDGSN
jgi:hypothetical protein